MTRRRNIRTKGIGPTETSSASAEQQPDHPSRKTAILLSALLCSATVLAYLRVLSAEFTYLDDRAYVTENEMVRKGLTWEGIQWAFTTVHASNWHPLTWLSHMLDWSLYEANAGGHHLTNLILHAVNVLLLFHVMCRMTGAVWASAFVAGAFGLHPTHVESVAWVAERKDVLSTCLGLLTLIAYVQYVRGNRSRRAGRYLLVIALYGLSLCAKPMLVTLPFVLLLLDYWPLRRTTLSPPRAKGEAATPLSPPLVRGEALWRLVVEKIPLLVLAAASCAVTVYAQRAGGAMMTQSMLSGATRVSNAIVSYAKYLWMTVWPAGLAVYYPHPLKAHPVLLVAGAATVLLAITVLVIVARRRHPYLLVGWLWFLGTLVPVIGLVQVGGQALADRYTYVPTIGLFIMAAWGLKARHECTEARRHQGLARGMIAALVLIVLAVCTWVQAGYWRDSVTLFQRALDVVPDNPQAHIFMANTLIGQGKTPEAVPHFAEAVRIVPNEPFNLTDYGHALLDSGKVDEAAAQLEEALTLKPDFADAHFFLGVAQVKQGKHAQAIAHLQSALQRDPRLLGAHLHMGTAYAAQRQWAAAITSFQKWLQVDPHSVEAKLKMAQCYHALGNVAAAEEILKEAALADPKNPYPLALMAQMAAWAGQTRSAIEHYENALKIDPRYAEAANNLALILATHPQDEFRNGARAVELAQIAARAHQMKDPVTLDTLAAALAEAGRFSEAIQTIESAIALGRLADSQAFVQHLETRRLLYQAGKAARAE